MVDDFTHRGRARSRSIDSTLELPSSQSHLDSITLLTLPTPLGLRRCRTEEDKPPISSYRRSPMIDIDLRLNSPPMPRSPLLTNLPLFQPLRLHTQHPPQVQESEGDVAYHERLSETARRYPHSPTSATSSLSSSSLSSSSCSSEDSLDESLLSDQARATIINLAQRTSQKLARTAELMFSTVEANHSQQRKRTHRQSTTKTPLKHITSSKEDWTFVYRTQQGTLIYKQQNNDDPLTKKKDKAKQTTSPSPSRVRRFLGFTKVKATLNEFTGTFGGKDAVASLHPDMVTCRQLHTLVDGDTTWRVINWNMLLNLPKWSTQRKRRDLIVVESHEPFTVSDGRRGWVQSLHSVRLPWCPPMNSASHIIRAGLYQSGVVALESLSSPGWIDLMCTVELDLKGNVSRRVQRQVCRKYVEQLGNIPQMLIDRRLQQMTWLDTHQFNQRYQVDLNKVKKHCAVCLQPFGTLQRTRTCRKCAHQVCRRCSSTRKVGALAKETKKKAQVCTACVMASQPDQEGGCRPAVLYVLDGLNTEDSTSKEDLRRSVVIETQEKIEWRNLPQQQLQSENPRSLRPSTFPLKEISGRSWDIQSCSDEYGGYISTASSNYEYIEDVKFSQRGQLPMTLSEF